MKKIIFIVIDGLSDRPIPQLSNKTPLEKAKTPNLDSLVKKGICGLVEPFLLLGQEKPESDTCHLALFGYEPRIFYLGRGPYEAAGVGIRLKEGDVALRANFGTVDENMKVVDRRAGRIEKTQSLIKALSKIKVKGIEFILKKSSGHRLVLVLKGKNISSAITDSDPKKAGEKVKKILPEIEKAKFTAKALNQFLEKAHSILKNHPLNQKRIKKGLFSANYLLVRGAGQFRETPSFNKRYGFNSCCIAGGGLYKGIAKILGMKEVKVKGATGLPNTNLRAKFLAVKKSLDKYNFVFLHIKAADSLAEDGNFLLKKAFIEKIDKELKPILKLKDVFIVVTADHSTCCQLQRHCSELIPVLICGDGRDNIQKFSERACQKGKLGRVKQIDLMSKILKLT